MSFATRGENIPNNFFYYIDANACKDWDMS